MQEKKISVIIPCYNVSEYIDRCMMSIENQTFGVENLEIILVDDASTDDTPDKLKEWEAKLPENIIVILNDINGRQGKARNVGLNYAGCDWIAFIDSDDWIEPTYFERLYNAADKNDCDIAYCGLKRDFSKELSYSENTATGRQDRIFTVDSKEKRKQFAFYADVSFPAHSKLIRKSVLTDNKLLFPERLAYEDCCWGSLLYYYVNKIYYVEEELYHYFVNETSTVLSGNSEYHTDLLTVHLILWDEYLKRGLYPEYKDEIEYNFLYTCYLGFIKILANRYENPSFSQFNLMRQIVLERVSDYKNNRYIKNGDIKELHLAIIEMLDRDMDKKSFLGLLEAVRRSGM